MKRCPQCSVVSENGDLHNVALHTDQRIAAGGTPSVLNGQVESPSASNLPPAATSDTPRTDEEVEIAKKCPATAHDLWVSAEHARRLERELNAAQVFAIQETLDAAYWEARAKAAQRDAERWRKARSIFSIEDIALAAEDARRGVCSEEENRKADAAIDSAMAKGWPAP